MTFSDIHCHLDRYQPELLIETLEQARTKGVSTFVSVGKTVESSANTVRLAQSHEGVKAAIGIHPWDATSPTDEVRRQLRELAKRENVVAVGEIGLDYVRNPETKELQKELLIYQLALAREAGLPVNIHCKEAHQDMMDILRNKMGPDIKGLIHGFSGDLAALKDWLALGFYVSIGVRGFVANEIASLQEAAREIPLDRLLTETDSSGGGQPTGPVEVLSVAEKLASLKGVTVEEIASAVAANIKGLLSL